MERISLDDKTVELVETILGQREAFDYMVNEMCKELTAEQGDKLRREVNSAFDDMTKLFNEYKP